MAGKKQVKKIRGFGGNYSISRKGVVTNRSGKALKPRLDRGGYSIVNLKHKGSSKTVRLHRVVSQVHLKGTGKIKNRVVHHKDNNRSNPSASNLQRTTYSNNNLHKNQLRTTTNSSTAHRKVAPITSKPTSGNTSSVRKHTRTRKNGASVVRKHNRRRARTALAPTTKPSTK